MAINSCQAAVMSAPLMPRLIIIPPLLQLLFSLASGFLYLRGVAKVHVPQRHRSSF